MKVLVTGAAGFIGSHLAEALCRRGAKVIALDNLSTGRVDNLAWGSGSENLEFIKGDVLDTRLLSKLAVGCDWIFHEAALASVPASVAQPVLSNDTNIGGTLNVLMAARDAHVKRLLFASSSAIYGDSEPARKSEGMPPNPLSPYALQKYAGESYAMMFHRLYGLETVSLRYFNVFGPRQGFDSPYSGVIAKFCTAMLAGRPPTVFGDGKQSRDFVYVDNAVQANLAAAEAPAGRVAGKIFNIGTAKAISLLELIRDVNALTGQNIEPAFKPPRTGDVRLSQADISAATECLGYQVTMPWKQGLAKTIEFYRQRSALT